MKQTVLGVSAALVLSAWLAGCSGLPTDERGGSLPPALPSGAAGISEVELFEARSLYVAKCAKCHRFYHPADYSEADWASWMTKMSWKSKLKPDQEELLSRYLGAFRLTDPSDKAGSSK